MRKFKKNSTNGITLIALVITIIVLLILAGVSIAMLTGDNGILKQVNNAKDKNTVGQEKEAIRLAWQSLIMDRKSKNNINLISDEELKNQLVADGENIDNVDVSSGTGKLTVKYKKSGNLYTIDQDGNVENIEDSLAEIKIPNGFYYVGGTKESGIIISDNEEDKNKGDSYDVTQELKGNQFVWIPVETPVCKDEITLQDKSQKNNEINRIIELINNDEDKMGYPMSIKINYKNKVEYVGILYDVEMIEEEINNNKKYSTKFTAIPYSQENGFFREPDVAITADRFQNYLNILGFTSISEFESEIHRLYNNMVESVKKYGGFFIARYETCMPDMEKQEDKNSEIVFKKNREVMTDKNWYEFYKMHKDYGVQKKSDIISNSIWGSQWDQVMLFMKDEKNEISDGKPYILDAKGMGVEPNNIKANSGSNEKYQVKNIFDLAGNVYEYTLETRSETTHTKRSSCFQKGVKIFMNVRSYIILNNDSNRGSQYDGGRCSFYIL